jgi:hypothetical protein
VPVWRAPVSTRHYQAAASIAALYIILDIRIPDRSAVINRSVKIIVAVIAAISIAITAKSIA